MTAPASILLPGSKTHLRDFQPSDVDDVAAIIGDDRVTVWLSFDSRNHAQAEQMISTALGSATQSPRTEYYLGVVLPDTDQVIGFARLALNGVRAAKLGYAIHADHWGQGFATDAAHTILQHGFQTLGLHRITAAVGPDNHASRTVLARLGFIHEGRLRDHVFTNGAWRDSLLYSLLETEWIAHEGTT